MMEEDLGLAGVPKKVRVPFGEAQKVSDYVEEWIQPLTESVVLVGSMRRGRPYVGDVEFVVLPGDLDQFHKAMVSLGFTAGAKRRKYTRVVEGLKVELYVAHKPEELGGLMFTYTGDLLFNVAMRQKAKRMGYKLNQYGILKGQKYVLQSADEREFFDFLGVEYHAPEERSLARREELRKAVREILKRKLKVSDRVDMLNAELRLTTPAPLDPELEEKIVKLGRKAGLELGSTEMGFEALPDEDVQDTREIVQASYDKAIGRGGQVVYMDTNIAYNVVQVLAAVREGDDELIYLLKEMTDLPGQALETIAVDPVMFLKDLVEAAGRGEVRFDWQGPFRPMVE